MIRLADIVDALDVASDETSSYLHRTTGEVRIVTDEERRLAEGGADADDLPDWQAVAVAGAREVVDSDDWLPLPSRYDVHEWAIMDAFARALGSDDLQRALRGRGAFRHFRDAVHRLHLEDRWHAHRAQALQEIARRWLDENGLACEPAAKSPGKPRDNTAYRFPVSVKGVVIRAGAVALCENERGEWELPGGKLEPDESPADCVVREIAEELCLDVTATALLDTWVYRIAPDVRVLIVTYGCAETTERDLTCSDEHGQVRWVPLDEVPALRMPDGYKAAIRAWAARGRASG